MKLAHIYRMTHIENISHILEYGITHKSSKNANSDFVTIGDTSLITTRNSKEIIVDNGIFPNSNAATITLGDFIPFYFGVRMPMLYVIQNGGNFVEKPILAENIVYIVFPINFFINSNIEYYFSDGHATDNLTTFYHSSKVAELSELVDAEAVKSAYWGGSENLDIKRKKQAEFLVSGDLPSEHIIGFVCQNEKSKERLITMGVNKNSIKIYPSAYY